MKVYLVIEDLGQDNGIGVDGITATEEEAIALVRKLNPRHKVNWPHDFDIYEWEVGATEETRIIHGW